MRVLLFALSALAFVGGCGEVSKQPDLPNESIGELNPYEVEYDVTAYDASPAVVSKANGSRFNRTVNSSEGGKRLTEASLFRGAKPPANKKTDLRLVEGDTVEVVRSGYVTSLSGVRERETIRSEYVVDERGAIQTEAGSLVFVAGLSLDEAREAVSGAIAAEFDSGDRSSEESFRSFPITKPEEYRIGPGDVIRVSRLTSTSNSDGDLTQRIATSGSVVGPDGVVSILQLGDLFIAGLTLPEFRREVVRVAVRNAVGAEVVVEVEEFNSKFAYVTGINGAKRVALTNQEMSYSALLSEFGDQLASDRDYTVTLERADQIYKMKLHDFFTSPSKNSFYVHPGDQIDIKEILPESSAGVFFQHTGERSVSYLRVARDVTTGGRNAQVIPFNPQGIDLRQLLVSQRVGINHNEDLLIKLNRAGKEYRLSAQSVMLDRPSVRYWLEPDDHITVEDIAYVGNSALLVGEIGAPQQFPIDEHSRTTLSSALFSGGAFSQDDADYSHIYVLRGSGQKYDAYHFDITQVLNLSLVDQFELRPSDIVFVRTRPITRYNNVLALVLRFAGSLNTLRTIGN